MASRRLRGVKEVVNRRERNQCGNSEPNFPEKAVLDLWLMGGHLTDGIRAGMLAVEARRAEMGLVMAARHEYFVIGQFLSVRDG